MVHRSAPRRIAVPIGGFGSQLNLMRQWLDDHAGREGYFTGSETVPGRQDAALFYFVDAKIAAAFVDRFACGLVVGREAAAGSGWSARNSRP